jgi:Putative esterase
VLSAEYGVQAYSLPVTFQVHDSKLKLELHTQHPALSTLFFMNWLFSVLIAAAVSFMPQTPLRFEVTVSAGLSPQARDGRLFIILAKPDAGEPRLAAGNPGINAPRMFARDVARIADKEPGVIDDKCVAFPLESLRDLEPGEYNVQAVYDTNRDLRGLNSPGNLFSRAQRMKLDAARTGTVRITLSEQIPTEALPPNTDLLRFIKFESTILSRFRRRPTYMRAGILLPRDHARETTRRYPMRVHIGGYGSRYTQVSQFLATDDAGGRGSLWLANDTPQMILVHLDGAGPYGDPYQVNSENNGPYGDALTSELIPFIEREFRGNGKRVLDGGSTGGWVSLALQIFYPDFFSGTWSFCPDGVDFRGFQLIDIYRDTNAYVNENGFERPAARTVRGDIRYTMRHECGLENVLGRGDSWTLSGGQWGAWNAVYGPRGAGMLPVPLWDPKTGVINRSVVEHWKKYDLRLYLEQNSPGLSEKLKGRLNIWMGDADDYFLNNALHLFDDSLKRLNPTPGARIVFRPGQGHCWQGISQSEMMIEMAQAGK